MNIRTKKIISPELKVETREKINWVRDLYSFYKPLINSKTELSELKKDELRNTLFNMEKTLEDVISEIKTVFLYDSKVIFHVGVEY